MDKRRLIKFLILSFITLITLLVIVYFSGRWILGNQYKMEFLKSQIDGWVNEINQSPAISRNFLEIYDGLYSNPEEKSIRSTYHDYVWKHLTGF